MQEEEQFFDMLEDEIDVEKAVQKKLTLERQKTQEWAAKERQKKPSASMKVYFGIERMQLMLMKESGDEEGLSEQFM